MIRVRLLHSYGNAVVTMSTEPARRLIAEGWAEEVIDAPLENAALRIKPTEDHGHARHTTGNNRSRSGGNRR
jgi:hypothetical protein